MHYTDYVYDIETYPNIFTLTAIHEPSGMYWQFELSTRRNQLAELLQFLWWLKDQPGARMVGFDNESFDYPVTHYIMMHGMSTTLDGIYQKSQQCIKGDRWSNIVWESDRFIEQVDLFKIHHFDNKAKSTSLKMLEFNMRSDTIEDLPFEPGHMLTEPEMDELLLYNHKDCRETLAFLHFSYPAIQFREELSEQFGRNLINFNDTKIGKERFIADLEKAGIPCYTRENGRREPRQTLRQSIHLGDVILPSIYFQHPALAQFHEWLKQQTITETKGVFKGLGVTVNGFTFDFGLGGLHGSIDSAVVESDEQYQIIDLDVASYYPSLAIVNRFYPAHLGPEFCTIYEGLKTERFKHPKKSAINRALKLALNGSYGDSNNDYSPLKDPQFTMSITVNGQLLLCMLSEWLMNIPGLHMIQANTDGVTVLCPRQHIDDLNAIRAAWEQMTGLELEEALYSRMFIRDVNNYIAEYEDGNLKRKGAYGYETPLENPDTGELEWDKNHSARVVAKAAESALVDGEDIRSYITAHPDPFDFMLRTKVPRGSRLMLGTKQLQNITRYYISNAGGELKKIMPPIGGKEWQAWHQYQMPDGTVQEGRTKTETKRLEKKGTLIGTVQRPAPERVSDINKGWLVTPANDLRGVTSFDFNYEWYIAEAEKLVTPLRRFAP